MRSVGYILLLVAVAIGGYFVGAYKPAEVVTITNEVVRVDTVVVEHIVEHITTQEVVRYDTIKERIVEVVHDSVIITLPIERKVYADSLYRAVVSGYNPNLDSITVYPRTTIVREVHNTFKRNPFYCGVGAQVGFGITPKGWQPYAGVGISVGFTF